MGEAIEEMIATRLEAHAKATAPVKMKVVL